MAITIDGERLVLGYAERFHLLVFAVNCVPQKYESNETTPVMFLTSRLTESEVHEAPITADGELPLPVAIKTDYLPLN